ncbi:putative inactive cadmium/zinc-transporting ATPase HMA3 [Panicum miliaceum]|uniref:Inactive cadmium/zinc-transporting ATPase HMA3 n=1 Tax=Panicum miliaceum TaxID=4540 RepID=A0A3L6QW96_PANMI|nr:putative inactive cadmium/zinc-transporting ATPase HMA3 [Panicum miliaceum]
MVGGAGRPAGAPEAAELEERLLPLAAPGSGDVDGGGGRRRGKWEKTYLDVLGVCCSAEVALVERLLAPIDGVRAVTVVVPSRTVIVEHDPAAVSQSRIVKALNKAGLEASVRAYGSSGVVGRWPSPYILASGALLLASFLAPLLPPLRWLALAAACAGAPPMLLRAFAAATRLALDINVLMVVAVAGAAALGDYAEAGAIVFLFITAEWLETLACAKAGAGMSSLMSTIPPRVVLAGTGEVVSLRDVKVGAVVAVRAGEVVPIDGVVVDGQSEVDESSLTGESFPVPKQPPSEVWAGTINLDGYIAVRTTALAENSTVAKMERLVEAAQNSRSKTQRLIDSCSKYYTPASVALVPLLLGAQDMKRWFQLTLVLLVSACPCALVLSTPVATFCALLRAARMGVLIKGGDILESLGGIRVAAFDKTGTITKGEFSIDGFHVVGDKAEMSQLLYWVSSIESKSSHPMAAALVEYAQSKSVQPNPEKVTEFRIYPGEGIYGEINGRHVYIGNRRIMARSSCQTVSEIDGVNVASIGYVVCDGDLVGSFSLSDDCRTGAAEAIRELRSMGIKSVMLTGDSRSAAMRAQEQLGGAMEELHSELLPADKVGLVGDLKARDGPTLMVGDGLNDAPALAMADVGVTMGLSGSAAAMETSHATLMSSDILRVPAAVRLGRRARRTIAANVAASVAAKAAVAALAVAWRPVLWAAVLADVGTCLLVVLHSMTLLREPGTARRGSRKEDEACRATVRSLAMRSQLAGASSTATASAGAPGGGTNGCHCCQKPTSRSFEQAHSVVIDIPAASSAGHQELQVPRTAAANGNAGGCCSAGRACGASTVTSGTRAPRKCCARKEDGAREVGRTHGHHYI